VITWATKYLHPSIVTSSWPLQFFFTVLLSWWVFGDLLSALQWIAAAFIIIGMLGVALGAYEERQLTDSSEPE
jgi:drug/metabolite transporter (DMT)-like permease